MEESEEAPTPPASSAPPPSSAAGPTASEATAATSGGSHWATATGPTKRRRQDGGGSDHGGGVGLRRSLATAATPESGVARQPPRSQCPSPEGGDEAYQPAPLAPAGIEQHPSSAHAAPKQRKQAPAAAQAERRRFQPPRPGKEGGRHMAPGLGPAAPDRGGGNACKAADGLSPRYMLYTAFPLGFFPPLPPLPRLRPGHAPAVMQAPPPRPHCYCVVPLAAPRCPLRQQQELPPGAFVATGPVTVIRVPLTPREAAAADMADAERARVRVAAAARQEAQTARKERALSSEVKRLLSDMPFPEPPPSYSPVEGAASGGIASLQRRVSAALLPPLARAPAAARGRAHSRAGGGRAGCGTARGAAVSSRDRQSALLDLAAVAAAALEPGSSSGGGCTLAGKKRGRLANSVPSPALCQAPQAQASSKKARKEASAAGGGARAAPKPVAPKSSDRSCQKAAHKQAPPVAAKATQAAAQRATGSGSSQPQPSSKPLTSAAQARAPTSAGPLPGSQSGGGLWGSATPQAAQAAGSSGRAPRAPSRKPAAKPRRSSGSSSSRARPAGAAARPPSGAGAGGGARTTAFQLAQQDTQQLPSSLVLPGSASVLRQGSVTLVGSGPSGPPPPFVQLSVPSGSTAGVLAGTFGAVPGGSAPAPSPSIPDPFFFAAQQPPQPGGASGPGSGGTMSPPPRLLPLPSREMSGAFLLEPYLQWGGGGASGGGGGAASAGGTGSPTATALHPMGGVAGLLDPSSPGQQQLLAALLQPDGEYLEAYRQYVAAEASREPPHLGAAGSAAAAEEGGGSVGAASVSRMLAQQEAAAAPTAQPRPRLPHSGGPQRRRHGGRSGGGGRQPVGAASEPFPASAPAAAGGQPGLGQDLRERAAPRALVAQPQTAGLAPPPTAAAPQVGQGHAVGLLLQSTSSSARVAAADARLMGVLRAHQRPAEVTKQRLQELVMGQGTHLCCPCGMDVVDAASPFVRCVCCGVLQHAACVASPEVAREQLGGEAVWLGAAEGAATGPSGGRRAPAPAGGKSGRGDGGGSGGGAGCGSSCGGGLGKPPTFDLVDVAAAAGEVRGHAALAACNGAGEWLRGSPQSGPLLLHQQGVAFCPAEQMIESSWFR
jgi:hypothetical protein